MEAIVSHQPRVASVQDYMHATYRTSVTSAQAQLLTLQTQLRTQLYASYLEQVQEFSPSYRERGRRCVLPRPMLLGCRRQLRAVVIIGTDDHPVCNRCRTPSTRIGERLLSQMLADAAPKAMAQVGCSDPAAVSACLLF